jgi:uncharacterized OB-fold protein
MSETIPAYPQPREDTDNAAFLAGWRRGQLVVQRCGGCGTAFFYPRPLCPSCWSTDLSDEVSAGRGTIVSYSAIERPNDPAFNGETPILLAEVRLAEGATLLARIVGCRREDVASGIAVELPPPDIAARYPLPVFRPCDGDDA